MNPEDHDILIRIDENLSNLKNSVTEHVKTDKMSFEKIDSQIAWLQKIVFMGIGVFVFLKFIIK